MNRDYEAMLDKMRNGEGFIAGKVQAADQNGDVKVTGTFVAAVPHRA